MEDQILRKVAIHIVFQIDSITYKDYYLLYLFLLSFSWFNNTITVMLTKGTSLKKPQLHDWILKPIPSIHQLT